MQLDESKKKTSINMKVARNLTLLFMLGIGLLTNFMMFEVQTVQSWVVLFGIILGGLGGFCMGYVTKGIANGEDVA